MSEPTHFGRFEVESILGRGAMGIVYLATDSFLGRKVAIKTVQAHPGLDEEEVAELHDRFVAEARAASSMSHPNLVTVYDVGQEGDRFYIAMEYVRGEGLDKVLRSDRVFSFKEVADLAVQVCSALDYAHSKEIVHRDIKPGNIMLTRAGRPKIADFGVARRASSTLTRTGTLIGTPAYMSPEQITGHEVSGASDQFSFAVVLFQMLTGEQPFDGENPTTLMYRIVHDEPRLPRSFNDQLPEALDRALARALAKDPGDRYPSCMDFAEEVREALGAAQAGAAELLGSTPDVETPSLEPAPIDDGVAPEAPTLSLEFAPATPTPPEEPDTSEPAEPSAPAAPSREQAESARRGEAEVPSVSPVAAWLDRLPIDAETLRSPVALGVAGVAALVLLASLAVAIFGGGSGGESSQTATRPSTEAIEPGSAPARNAGAETSTDVAATPGEAPVESASAGPASLNLAVRTDNDPARLFVDGELLTNATPTSLVLEPGREYALRIEKEGFESVSSRHSLEGLTPDQRDNAALFFPLTPVAPSADETAAAEGETEEAGVSATASPLISEEELDPIRVPSGGVDPETLEAPTPEFPQWAEERGLQRYVVVQAVIDTQGRVRSARVLRDGDPDLDALAIETVLTWTFTPATLDGEPIAVIHNTTVQFRDEEVR